MLSTAWVRRLLPGTRRVMVFGETEAARQIAQGAGSAGYRVSRHDISYLQGDVDADGIILDAGEETATLAQARKMAARITHGTIGVVVESWSGVTAALALDAELGTRGVRLRPLCAGERSARAVLAQHPWWRLRHAGKPSIALIAGTGPLAEHLVIALFRAMHGPHQTPQVVVTGPDAPDWVATLQARLPQLAQIGSLTGARRAPGLENVGVIYALRDDADLASFPAAVPLAWLGEGTPPQRARPATLPGWREMAQSLFGDSQDARARAIHDFYFESALRDGNMPGSRPSMLDWASLPERFRQASRYQADHVPAKLAMIGCRAVTAAARWRFRFGAGEVDRLARVEHERWSAVQLLDGWRYGATRDDAARLTPFLAPYDSLAPEIQDRDRMPVRQIPAQLARIGQAVKRDIVVTLTTDSDAAPGFAFSLLFRSLLADIAARYPERQLVLASALDTELERRAAANALDRKTAPLWALLPGTASHHTEALLARADRLLVLADGDIAAQGGLHIHVGDYPPKARRLVLLDANGRVRSAPWL
jgi:hypothetical protein